MAKWAESSIPDLSGKRALVTGAASGIGYETTRVLAQRGAEVMLLDCNATAGQAAVARIRALHKDAKVHFEYIDLANRAEVRAFAHQQLAQGDGIDLLINNAGISATHERRTSDDGFELTFGIGHLGHFALTGQLLPALLKTPEPRVISVSSLAHKAGAIDWADLHMAHRYTAMRPYTHIIKAAQKSVGRLNITDYVSNRFLSGAMSLLGQHARAGARPILFAATSPHAKGGGYYGPDGIGERRGAPKAAKIHPPAQCRENARKLWEISERLTGVHFSALSSPA